MRKEYTIWLYLCLICLFLSLTSSYFLFYPLAVLFLAIAFLSLILLFFDCKKNKLCRLISSFLTRILSISFLLLFFLAVTENVYSFMPNSFIKEIILSCVWVWIILFLLFFPISRLFREIVKSKVEKSYSSVK